ncbi:hypothetical protein E4U14_001551 [Claviceps sp. LM454 group G7]|nr:hypothetical protein E4U14_001551 [Claviceps sp. LM454 group G7]
MAETEMMAYLDFTTAGNERVEAVVREMMAAEGYRTQYRAVWKFAEEDGAAQEEKYRRLG